MRSLWKGHIRFSMVTIPIRLYNAVDSGSSLRFNQLHKEDNGRVRYEKVCRSCGEVADVPCLKGRKPCLTPPAPIGASVDEAQVIFRGLCKNCQSKT